MSDDWESYVKDPRTVCKYGVKCYQKNSDHHKMYKHPPKFKKSPNQPSSKRFKTNSKEEDQELEASSSKNDFKKVSDTERLRNSQESVSSLTNTEKCIINLPDNISFYDKDADTKILQELFLVEMPRDFFEFYNCLNDNWDSTIKLFTTVNLELVGPYDLLLGKLPILDNKELYLIHWRYFYDPPEFQTVLKVKGKHELHMGYFRDDPRNPPTFVASNNSADDCHITPLSDNIFGAVYLYLQNKEYHSPFTAMACQKLSEIVKKWAVNHNYSLDKYNMKKRLSQAVTKTFHGAGIVVPYDKKTQLGYRNLVESDANIKKLFHKLNEAKSQKEKDDLLSELQPIITYAVIAVDECDFGTGLEIGIDLFCSGLKELEPSALSCLSAAYSLLNRDAYKKIIQAHLKYRRKGADLSVISTK